MCGCFARATFYHQPEAQHLMTTGIGSRAQAEDAIQSLHCRRMAGGCGHVGVQHVGDHARERTAFWRDPQSPGAKLDHVAELRDKWIEGLLQLGGRQAEVAGHFLCIDLEIAHHLFDHPAAPQILGREGMALGMAQAAPATWAV